MGFMPEICRNLPEKVLDACYEFRNLEKNREPYGVLGRMQRVRDARIQNARRTMQDILDIDDECSNLLPLLSWAKALSWNIVPPSQPNYQAGAYNVMQMYLHRTRDILLNPPPASPPVHTSEEETHSFTKTTPPPFRETHVAETYQDHTFKTYGIMGYEKPRVSITMVPNNRILRDRLYAFRDSWSIIENSIDEKGTETQVAAALNELVQSVREASNSPLASVLQIDACLPEDARWLRQIYKEAGFQESGLHIPRFFQREAEDVSGVAMAWKRDAEDRIAA